MSIDPITFVCPGKPLTWQRAQRGRYGSTFTPADRESKMSEIRDSWRSLEVEPFAKRVDLALGLQVFCMRPATHFRTNGALKPWALTARPRSGTNGGDLDNFCKLVLDALNLVAFYDDTQIVEYISPFGKWYAGPREMPRTEITLAPVLHLAERPEQTQFAAA
jgi:Holliday junction resolvase RusA-like endonuclease